MEYDVDALTKLRDENAHIMPQWALDLINILIGEEEEESGDDDAEE